MTEFAVCVHSKRGVIMIVSRFTAFYDCCPGSSEIRKPLQRSGESKSLAPRIADYRAPQDEVMFGDDQFCRCCRSLDAYMR